MREGWFQRLPRGVGLVMAMGVAWLLLCPVAYYFFGRIGITANSLAALVCLGGTLAAIGTTYRFRGPEQVVHAVLLGMLLRMALPLVACLIVYQQKGPMAEAGTAYFCLVFYMLSLGVETWTTVGPAAAVESAAVESTAVKSTPRDT